VPIPSVPATGATREQIQAAIAAIQNNIVVLLAELAKLQQPTTTQAFTQDLYYGLWNNADVKRLQEFLISKGYLTGTATGNYYLKTVEAVKAYQTAKGIAPANGRFGPKTRQAANLDLGL
jgi:murein L,D-transpeptidase YcbB/YkuD